MDDKQESEVDYSFVEQQLKRLKFSAKKTLPFIQRPFYFHAYGFENKSDRKLLCKATKELMKKYPKKDKKSKSKRNAKMRNEKKENEDANDNLEGFVIAGNVS